MVRRILRAVQRGEISLEEATRLLEEGHLPGGRHARFDLPRVERTGLPEVLLGEGKQLAHFQELVDGLDRTRTGAILSRLTDEELAWLPQRRAEGVPLEVHPLARLAILRPEEMDHPLAGRNAALLSAGTADARIAEEVRLTLEALGAEVACAFDVGVAGLHRLLRVLPRLQSTRPGVYVVCAGREGALATVVAGLVDRPVIGVPTSQGYGRGGGGEAALNAMLQSCVPLAVVNIDAGIPAALVAAQVLRSTTASGAGARRGGRRRVRARNGQRS